MPGIISFRPLHREDLPLMCRWLNTDFVIAGYGKEPQTAEQVAAKYIPRIDGTCPTRPFIILSGDAPIGYIQTFRFVDHPDYNRLVQAGDDVAGIDLFIGESSCVHRGLGPVVLRQFLRDVVFAQADIRTCVVGPSPANAASIRANEKAGFRYWKEVRSPNGEVEHLMHIGRGDVESAGFKKAKRF